MALGKAADVEQWEESLQGNIDNGSIMNRLVASIIKTLTLVAILLLPVQQTLAATCCCHRGRYDEKQTVKLPARCCSSCCGGADSHESSFGNARSSSEPSKPCRCPGGCRSHSGPTATTSTTTSPSLEDESGLERVARKSTLSIGSTAHHSVENAFVAVLAFPKRGSERCAQLCRYRL